MKSLISKKRLTEERKKERKKERRTKQSLDSPQTIEANKKMGGGEVGGNYPLIILTISEFKIICIFIVQI